MTSARADRIKAVAEALHGRVLDRNGDTMTVEVPADVGGAFSVLMGEGGMLAIFRSQSTRLAPRRVVSMQGQVIVCEHDPVTTAFYKYSVDLRPRDGGVPAPGPGDITRPPPPPR